MRPLGRRAVRKRLADVLTYLVLIVAVALTILPFVWMISSSLSVPATTISGGLEEKPEYSLLIPYAIHLDSYRGVFATTNFLLYVRNSILIAGATTALSIVIAVLGGYALSRFRFTGRVVFGQVLLAMYMFPGVLLVIPIFIVLKTIGLFDSLLGLIVAYTTFSLPFCFLAIDW